MDLPEPLLQRAAFTDSEVSWRIDEFPSVLREAASLGLGCAGGQFQFRRSDGPICEMYWLEVDTGGRRPKESWVDYVARSEREVSAAFQKLCHETDWRHEVMEWKDTIYSDLTSKGVDPRTMLVFVAYFEQERA